MVYTRGIPGRGRLAAGADDHRCLCAGHAAEQPKTSYINISRQGIEVYGSGFVDIKSGGEMNIEAGSAYNLRAGAGSKSIGMSNNHMDEWFMWAGAAAPGSAPFRVHMDGRVYATNLQQVYSQSFWDFWIHLLSRLSLAYTSPAATTYGQLLP